MVTPDGMPLVWISRMMGFRRVERVYGPDLMLEVCALSVERRYRHFLYGGAPGVAQKLEETLRLRFPGIDIAGTYCPPFCELSSEEDKAMVETINNSHADIVWIGLGTPKQEYWMAGHRHILDASVLVGVGAAFDFISGVKRQAPKWIQRIGLEWVFRLCAEPKRLARRYLVNNPSFLFMMCRQFLGRKPPPLAPAPGNESG
jgi:N-acetylglucosaminyldiphosphoundecaprenol N-acetyl-beta-D-mannosaminyltransferase